MVASSHAVETTVITIHPTSSLGGRNDGDRQMEGRIETDRQTGGRNDGDRQMEGRIETDRQTDRREEWCICT